MAMVLLSHAGSLSWSIRVLLLVIFLVTSECYADEKIHGKRSSLEMYRKLFEEHRAVQLEAVKSIQKFENYQHRYSLIELTLKKLFTVTEAAKQNLTTWGYLPGDPFPDNETMKEAVSKVLENTAMFGDLVLRNPDIAHAIYDRKQEWKELIGWSYWFCKESGVFDGMAQEVGLIPKEDTYFNPFKIENQLKQQAKAAESKKEQTISKAKKKKEKKMKGPRLSAARSEL